MKKLVFTAAIIWLMLVATFVAYHAGVRHAILDSELTIVEFYRQDEPYDAVVVVELDGELYDYDVYIG